LYIPNVSFAEARQSIQMKCQPVDGPGIHRYIRWAHRTGELNDERAEHAHRLAERYVQQVRDASSGVPTILRDVAGLSCVKVFALDDEMLDLATELALEKVKIYLTHQENLVMMRMDCFWGAICERRALWWRTPVPVRQSETMGTAK